MAENEADDKKIIKPQARTEDSVSQKKLDKLAFELLQQVVDSLAADEVSAELSEEWVRALKRRVYFQLEKVLSRENLFLNLNDKRAIVKMVMDDITGYGPINDMLKDPSVSEIMVNGPDQVYMERQGKIYLTAIRFRDNNHILHIIDKICSPLGRRVDESSPLVEARLPDGSRLSAVIPPVAFKGACLTIRKFSPLPYTQKDLIDLGTLSLEMLSFLRSCIRGRVNMIISGGSGCGKTTLLNVLSVFIPSGERIITIEDAAELQLKQKHVISLETRPCNIEGKGLISIRDLVINSLKMRPDRIIIGDVRSGEAFDMLQALNSGHSGSASTLHANTPRNALYRLETMVLMAEMDLPHRVIREHIASAIELIVHVTRFPDGSRKVTRISELLGLESDNYCMQDLFIFKSQGLDEAGRVTGRHEATGIRPSFTEKLKLSGETWQGSIFGCNSVSLSNPGRQGRGFK